MNYLRPLRAFVSPSYRCVHAVPTCQVFERVGSQSKALLNSVEIGSEERSRELRGPARPRVALQRPQDGPFPASASVGHSRELLAFLPWFLFVPWDLGAATIIWILNERRGLLCRA